MKKGRHRRFEEARRQKHSVGAEARRCPECGAEPDDIHASWCRAEEDKFEEMLGIAGNGNHPAMEDDPLAE